VRIIIDLAFAFLLLGLIEAIIKPIAKRFMRRRILAAARIVLPALDPIMPQLIANFSGPQMEQIVRTKLEVVTGESWAGDDISLLFRLFDPRIAADRAKHLRPGQ
jgi:hypothetical protein